MKLFEIYKTIRCRIMASVLTILIGCSMVHADDKKPPATPAQTPAAKPPAASVPKAPNASGVRLPGGGNAQHTNGGQPKGPTTGNPRVTTGQPKGPTTGGPGRKTGPGSTTAGTKPGSGKSADPRDSKRSPDHQPTVTATQRPLPPGYKEFKTSNGGSVTRRPDGRVESVHDERRHMDIHRGLGGERRVEGRRDDRRIVAERGGRGFVERPYRFGNREYSRRTYYYRGRAYDRYYHPYMYRGVVVRMYTPTYYYAPAFYGWAYNPWVAPVPYAWGWAGAPWYGYYGAYYAPYPIYPSASYWLTDYFISTTLAAAYEARVQAAAQEQPQAAGAVALTPQVKDLISAEVQRQIAIENAEAQTGAQNTDPNPSMSGIQAMMSDNVRHIFVADRSYDVLDAGGNECAISEGDALQLTGPPAAGANSATLVVLASKGGQDCRARGTVSVAFEDLQEMQNHMRETISQGMSELQSKQGNGGLPALPRSAIAPPVKAAFAAQAPEPDPGAAQEIAEQAKEADQAENEMVAEAKSPGGPSAPGGENTVPAPAATFQPLGKSSAEVIAHYGQPQHKMDLTPKMIFIYKDFKITFKDDKVVDVQ